MEAPNLMLVSREQEPAVLARGSDVLVTAGAGTGKTRTLVARYLSLLAEGLPLRSVVAITFTRKAAREMRNRVRNAIQEYRDQPSLSRQERIRWEILYSELDAARIDTIHGLCSEILRTHPAEAGVDPRFEVLEEGQAHLLQKQALEEALGLAVGEERGARLFRLLGEQGLAKLLAWMLGRRLDVQEALSTLPDDVLAHWQSALTKQQEAALNTLLSGSTWVENVAVLQAICADRSDDKMECQRRQVLDALQTGGTLAEQLEALSCLKQINLSGGSAKSWPGGDGDLKVVKDALRYLRDQWRAEDPGQWTLTAIDQNLAETYPALRALSASATERYASLKRQQDALDFDDLEEGALRLLRESTEVQAYWRGQVQALLVDEFQDTNGRQWELLAFLNGGRGKSFAVGDAKQSIYRFRGADVTVFREERKRIQCRGGQVLELKVSYRAHRELVHGLNDLLRPVLGESEEPDKPWVEPFSALLPFRAEAGPGFCAPHIELHLTCGTRGDGAMDRAADALATRLVELVEDSQLQVAGRNGLQAVGYEDVAVLCRASASFPYYEDAFERADIPFQTVAGGGFFHRPEVRDVLNALQALAYPADDLALVGLLRSPVFGLSDEELYRLCEVRRPYGLAVPLWDVLNGVKGSVESKAGRRAASLIQELHGLAGRTSVADLLKAFLDATDYRTMLVRTGHRRGAFNVSKLLYDAHNSGLVGVGEFLEYVQGLRDVAAREGEARVPVEGALQIMSVHQAKGLEFAIVVLGDVTKKPGNSARTLVDRELGILRDVKDDSKMGSSVYRLGAARDKAKEDAEDDRLLYVAATRAREKLILSGAVQDLNRDKEQGWLGRLLLVHGLTLDDWLAYDPQGSSALPGSWMVGGTPVACTVYEPLWSPCGSTRKPEQTLPKRANMPPPLLAPVLPVEEWADESTVDRQRDPPLRVWRVVPTRPKSAAPSWVVGQLFHEAVATWSFPQSGFERWAETRARSCGLTDPGQLYDAVRETRKLLQRFHDHPLFREMESAERRLHELPYSLERVGTPSRSSGEGSLENGTIDVLYLCKGRWHIVEFKTDEIRDELELRQVLDRRQYPAQLRRYAQAVEQLVGQRPDAQLCLLDLTGRIEMWPEEGLPT